MGVVVALLVPIVGGLRGAYLIAREVATKDDLLNLATKAEILQANKRSQALFLDIRISQEKRNLQELTPPTGVVLTRRELIDYTNIKLTIKELEEERLDLL